MSDDSRPLPRIRARGRSFLALVLSPEAGLDDWLRGLDAQIARSPSFFVGKPIILDLGLLSADAEGLAEFYPALLERGVRVIGIEGGDRSWPALAGWDWPDSFEGGRASGTVAIPEEDAAEDTPAPQPAVPVGALIVERPVRSGQSILYPDGDVIVIGSVASGAEISAGGSVHVYGTLRGRAIAGMGGQAGARIFATVMKAELVAIDGYYMIAEEIDPALTGRAVQALLEDDTIVVRAID
ncbi:septum site-determining protein MinC [Gluconacetobacter azotocaptans]|uniref:Probable septum site-determining protein MinC n=1 Tax=Gluconacetobacter azotocaptans TaxID=142834 RepID=A0A7W4JRG4_9PROT|nr:septum site-determining protein MinC [Gluconacetobacter azotocaptans]MBB2189572.1 septum site-determining protein MinC [Gluconacetobacter azotocaptans]GBQ33685.1 septum formation inhibitor [Gluconacetobacter azotocaptans DSM 13594]